MSYIRNNILPNENIIFSWKIHWFYSFISYIWIVFWVLFLVAWLQAKWPMWVIWFWIICVFTYNILFINTSEIVVTNKRVVYKTWVISRDVFELQLSKVESAKLNQTIFQRIIWAGTLIVSGTGWHSKPIINLARPTDLRTFIYQEIENNK